MSVAGRRRRALLLALLALACGALAASDVRRRVQEVEARVGPQLAVAVAARDLAAGAQLRRGDVRLREVPADFVPKDALTDPARAVGASTAVPLAAGSYLTAGALGAGAARQGPARPLRRGERAVEVAVSGGAALDESAAPGVRVDVLISTEPRAAAARTFVALEDVELLALRPRSEAGVASEPESGAVAGATAVATLRVPMRQAVLLAAAENFARELRLLPRPPGDRGRGGPRTVAAGAL